MKNGLTINWQQGNLDVDFLVGYVGGKKLFGVKAGEDKLWLLVSNISKKYHSLPTKEAAKELAQEELNGRGIE